MRSIGANEIDSHLATGGRVIAASDRTARAVRSTFNQRRRDEEKLAWEEPAIRDWNSFVRSAWEDRTRDEWMLLNAAQERLLWTEIARNEGGLTTMLEGSRRRIAGLADSAHRLLCDYAPALLRTSARAGWQNDALVFSRWLTALDERAQRERFLSAAQVQHRLRAALQEDVTTREPLLLIGFDRILPAQRLLLDAWGRWQQVELNYPADDVQYLEATDERSQLEACALWCGQQLQSDPGLQMLILCDDIASNRGTIERIFARNLSAPFEFSLGVPLSTVPLIQSAVLALRWLAGELAEHELDSLLSSGRLAVDPGEQNALLLHMRRLRARQLQRTSWPWHAFLRRPATGSSAPESFVQRVEAACRRLETVLDKPQPIRDFAELVTLLLDDIGWPGHATLSSEQAQVVDAWKGALDTCGTCGFSGKRAKWPEFLDLLNAVLNDTVFSPESLDAPVQIVGTVESAGLAADAIWFLGADESSWPVSGSLHPLLPPQVQRAAAMPHASPLADWEIAQLATDRLLHSAPLVRFSYSRLRDAQQMRPSRLIAHHAGQPLTVPVELFAPPAPSSIADDFLDRSKVPFAPGPLKGGASALSTQSQCPFKAFATFRLDAKHWEPAQAGLSPLERGQILHEALHSIWSGPPQGLRSLDDLLAVKDVRSLAAKHVRGVLQSCLPAETRQRLPKAYLALEEDRLNRLLAEWLEFEARRVAFNVAETEATRSVSIGGLTLHLRLDRLDKLSDDTYLVVDYKTGNVSPRAWDLPRPEDVQLPLYATFGLADTQPPGGLVFAKVQSGKYEFAGKLNNASETLLPELNARNALVNSPLSHQLLSDWKRRIETLAAEFLDGAALADPRQFPGTCDGCSLHALCRIQDFPPAAITPADAEDDDEQ